MNLARRMTKARMNAVATRIREDKAIYRALRIVEARLAEPSECIDGLTTAGYMFRLSLGGQLREHFEVAFLNTKHRLLARERLFSGTIQGASVSPRIVAQRALALNAAAVILAHNHPSGDPTPSAADIALTKNLQAALDLVEVCILDHIVIGQHDAASFAQLGLLTKHRRA